MLTIRLLGSVAVTSGDPPGQVALSPRLQALIALLALNRGRVIDRAWTAGQLWPDTPPEQALTNLRSLLHRLKRSVPEAATLLDATGSYLQWPLPSAYALDLHRLEAIIAGTMTAEGITEVMALYQGDLCADLDEEWLLVPRRRLRQELEGFLVRGATFLEEQRDYDRAIAVAERLRHLEPGREAAYQRLMRLHAVNEDRGRALQTYQQWVAHLGHSLNEVPSQVTRRLHTRLQAPAPAAGSRTPRQAPPLIGRTLEWRQLLSAWEAAARGRASALVLCGEVGIGKTRLAEELTFWAERQGIAVASTRCFAPHHRAAFDPVIRLLRGLPREILQDRRRRPLRRLLPELGDVPADVASIDEPLQRLLLYEAVSSACLERQPLLLFVDDLQWADGDTIGWLHYLLRLDRNARLLLLATVRDGELPHSTDVKRLLDELQRDHLLHRVDLPPLSQEEAAALASISGQGDVPEVVQRRIVARAAGNPLYLLELLRSGQTGIAGDLPQSIAAAVATRVTRLSTDARHCAELLALIGRACSWRLLEAAAPLEVDRLDAALDELWGANILVERDDGVALVHPVFGEYLRQSIDAPRRRRFHRSLATAFERPALRPEASAHDIARHLAGSGAREEAARAFLLAGAEALERYAYEAACECYSQALELAGDPGDPADRFVALQGVDAALSRLGREEERHSLHARMLQVARRANRRDWAAQAELQRAHYFDKQGEHAEAIRHLDEALEHAEAAKDLELKFQILEARAMARQHRAMDGVGAAADLRAALSCLRASGNELLEARARTRLSGMLTMMGELEEAERESDSALAVLRRLNHREETARALCYRFWIYLCRLQPEEALSTADEAVSLAREGANPIIHSMTVAARAISLGVALRFSEGLAAFDEALGMLEPAGPLGPRHEILIRRALLCLSLFDEARALEAVEAAIALGERLGSARHALSLTLGAFTAASFDRWERASLLVDAAQKLETPDAPSAREWPFHSFAAGLVARWEGDPGRATALLGSAVSSPANDFFPVLQVDAAAVLGELQLELGDAEGARAVLEPHIAALHRCPGMALFPQRVLAVYARILAALGQPLEAGRALDQARTLLEALVDQAGSEEARAALLAHPLHQDILAWSQRDLPAT